MSETRTMVIEGQRVQVETRPRPIPQKLPDLIAQLFAVSVRQDITPSGTSAQCVALREHRLTVIREGRHVGTDRVLRDLRIQMCRDCGAVCVRDISFDRLDGLAPGARGPARRDHILGWYSGARPNRREYT